MTRPRLICAPACASLVFFLVFVLTFLQGCSATQHSSANPPIRTEAQVSTYQYNNQRTGVNNNETILTRANVNTATFGKLFTQSVDGQIYAQPLYMPNVTINGAVHSVIFVATEHDSVYAFDADSNTGSNAQPLWKTSLIPSGETTVHATYCQDISPEYGITGTPVIDAATNTLYAVAETLQGPSNGNTYVKRLHALDITTGAEKPGSPVLISGANGISVTMPGQSPVTFDDLNDQYRGITIGSLWENQRAGLLFYNGVVYIAFGSHCDGGDNIPFQGVVGWRGWVLGYNGSSLNPVFVYSTEPSSVNGLHGGIWMSGQGLAMDSGSNLFFTTGNGNFDVSSHAYAQAVVRIDLSKGPTVQDYFSPYYNFVQSDGNNSDLGSSGIAILPDQQGPFPHLAVTGDKFRDVFVVNRDNLGQFNASFDSVVQELDLAIGEFFSSPVYFNGKVYFWGTNDVLKAFTLTNGMLSTSATDSGPDSFSTPGSVPTISANGTSNAILWALRCDGDAECSTGALYAYDPNNLSAGSIYNSNQNPSDSPGQGVKFAVPIVANGKVYVGSSGQWSAYGLLGGQGNQAPAITSTNTTTFTVGTAGSFTVTTTGSPTPTLTEATEGSYPLTITASNAIGTATQPFTRVVNATGEKCYLGPDGRLDAKEHFYAVSPPGITATWLPDGSGRASATASRSVPATDTAR
jgi:hypothetical protein